MGSTAHVVVVGSRAEARADVAVARLADLEARRSRFRPSSEVSQLNAAGGRPVLVSSETFALLTRAHEMFTATDGWFDPTVLGDVIRAGYDRDFEEVPDAPGAGHSELQRGFSAVRLDPVTRVVTMPAGVGFDPGGIGKGFAADVVVRELMADGAQGVSIAVGGDVRLAGVAPDGGSWRVLVDDPRPDGASVVVALTAGALATSAINRRAWTVDGTAQHHLVDPFTGQPARADVLGVTVIAREGWRAEGLTKMVVARGAAHGLAQCELLGVGARVARIDGTVECTESWPAHEVVISECAR
ncbi:MAG: FAD:protein FMN transferase [Acidimicrobiia bacterium]